MCSQEHKEDNEGTDTDAHRAASPWINELRDELGEHYECVALPDDVAVAIRHADMTPQFGATIRTEGDKTVVEAWRGDDFTQTDPVDTTIAPLRVTTHNGKAVAAAVRAQTLENIMPRAVWIDNIDGGDATSLELDHMLLMAEVFANSLFYVVYAQNGKPGDGYDYARIIVTGRELADYANVHERELPEGLTDAWKKEHARRVAHAAKKTEQETEKRRAEKPLPETAGSGPKPFTITQFQQIRRAVGYTCELIDRDMKILVIACDYDKTSNGCVLTTDWKSVTAQAWSSNPQLDTTAVPVKPVTVSMDDMDRLGRVVRAQALQYYLLFTTYIEVLPPKTWVHGPHVDLQNCLGRARAAIEEGDEKQWYRVFYAPDGNVQHAWSDYISLKPRDIVDYADLLYGGQIHNGLCKEWEERRRKDREREWAEYEANRKQPQEPQETSEKKNPEEQA